MNYDLKLHWQEDPAVCGWFISYLYRNSAVQMAAVSKELTLSHAQSIVLVGIYRREGINQRALADKIAMAPGVISRILRDLEDRGYVIKQRDEDNRRNFPRKRLEFLTPFYAKCLSTPAPSRWRSPPHPKHENIFKKLNIAKGMRP